MNIPLIVSMGAAASIFGSVVMSGIGLMYTNQLYTLASVVLGIIGLLFAFFNVILSNMMNPVMPYLDAIIRKLPLLIMHLTDNNLIFLTGKHKATTVDTVNFGSFIRNPDSIKTFVGSNFKVKINGEIESLSLGGVKTMLVYEENAVPPEVDLIKICTNLQEAGIESLEDWKEKAKNDEHVIETKGLDLKVIGRFFDIVNPHYLSVRIERIAAELAREYSQGWMKILPWVSIMMVALMFGAIAFVIIKSVMDGDTSSAPTMIPTINT